MSRSTVLLIRGGVGILFGVIVFSWQGLTILPLTGLFAAFAVIDGILSLWLGLVSTRTQQRLAAPVLRGLAGLLAGGFAFVWPDVTPQTLLPVIGTWAFVSGVLEIVAAVSLSDVMVDVWVLAIVGVMLLALSVLLFLTPGINPIEIAWALAAYAAASGVLLISLGLRLRTRQVVRS